MKVRAYLISMANTKILGEVVWNSCSKTYGRYYFKSDYIGSFRVRPHEIYLTDTDGRERHFNPRKARGY